MRWACVQRWKRLDRVPRQPLTAPCSIIDLLNPIPTLAPQRYYGTAVGKGRQMARNEIEKLNLKEMTAREAVKAVALILQRVHDEEKPFEAELAWVCDESQRVFQRVPQELVEDDELLANEKLEADEM